MANNQTQVRSARDPNGLLYLMSDWETTYRLSNILLVPAPQQSRVFEETWEEVSPSGNRAAQNVQHLAIDTPDVREMLVRVTGFDNLWIRKSTTAGLFPQPLPTTGGPRKVLVTRLGMPHGLNAPYRQLSASKVYIPSTTQITQQVINVNGPPLTLDGTTTPPQQDDNGSGSD